MSMIGRGSRRGLDGGMGVASRVASHDALPAGKPPAEEGGEVGGGRHKNIYQVSPAMLPHKRRS